MKRSRKFLAILIIVLFTIIACSGSRDVVGGQEPVAQSTEESSSVESEDSAEQTPPTDIPETEETISVEVVDVASYTSSSDSLYFIGLVENTGSLDLEFVEIHVTLRDEAGTLVASESGYSSLDVVTVGETSPFTVLFFDEVGDWSTYEVTVEASEADFLESYRDFEVVSSSGATGDFWAYEIVGEIRNTGTQDAEFVQVVVILYNSEGEIIGTDFTYSDFDKVTAGGTSPFTILVSYTSEEAIDHYELLVEGSTVDD